MHYIYRGKNVTGCGEAKLFAEQNRGWTENAHN